MDDMPDEHWVILAAAELAGQRAAREARDIVRNELSERLDLAVLDDALLATSEVVSNAVQYTPGPHLLTICHLPAARRLRIGVTDPDPTPLPDVVPPRALAATGRGLHIVNSLAVAWGAAPMPDGKEVWFELEYP